MKSPKFHFRKLEIAIFLVMSTIFAHSAYNFTTRKAGDSRTISSTPADTQKLDEVTLIELSCTEKTKSITTSAARVRVSGSLCEKDPTRAVAKTESKIENLTTKYSATVLHDYDEKKFSSDYIPLKYGENKISIEVERRKAELEILRN